MRRPSITRRTRRRAQRKKIHRALFAGAVTRTTTGGENETAMIIVNPCFSASEGWKAIYASAENPIYPRRSGVRSCRRGSAFHLARRCSQLPLAVFQRQRGGVSSPFLHSANFRKNMRVRAFLTPPHDRYSITYVLVS